MRVFTKNIITFTLLAVFAQLSAQTLHNPTIHSSGFYGNQESMQATGGVGAIGPDLYGSDEMRIYQTQFGPTSALNYNYTDRLNYCISYDYNQDGLDDVVALSDSFGGLIWYENLGNEDLGDPVFIQALEKSYVQSFSIEEMEDGKLYVVLVHFTAFESKSISRVLITEDQNFQEIEFINANFYHHEWYDLNGDGRLDLIYNSFVEDVSNQIYYKLNLPSGFSPEYILAHIDGLLAFSLEQWSWEDEDNANNQILYAAKEPNRIGSLSYNENVETFVVDQEVEVEDFEFQFDGIRSADPLITAQYEPATDAFQCYVFINADVYHFDKNEAKIELLLEWGIPISQHYAINGIGDYNGDDLLDIVWTRVYGTSGLAHFLYSTANDGEVDYNLAASNHPVNVASYFYGRGFFHQFNPGGPTTFIKYQFDLEGELAFELDEEWEASLVPYAEPTEFESMEVLDINGDGESELLCKVHDSYKDYVVLEMSEDGHYVFHEIYIVPERDDFDLIDLNLDGLLDIVLYGEEGIVFRENLGNFVFDEELSTFYSDGDDIGADAQRVDFDGDGIEDIIVATDKKVILMKGTGTSYQEETLLDGQSTLSQILAGDLNKDGVQDLIVHRTKDLLILMYDANGTVHSASERQVGHAKVIEGLIQQSGNDFPLLLLGTPSTSSQNLYYLQNNEGILGDVLMLTSAAKRGSCNILDYNGDGRDELIYANGLNQITHALFVGNGHYGKQIDPGVDFGVFRYLGSLHANEDERPDLLFLNESNTRRIIHYKENMPDLPKAEIGLPFGNCFGQRFINLSEAYYPESTVLWDFGDGNTSTEIHPEHNYADLGVYDIKLTICNDHGCDTATAQFEKITNIALDIPESASVDELVTFWNSSEGITDASWFFGDDEISLELEPSHSYNHVRPYTFEVYLTNDQVTDCTYFLARDINILGEGTGLEELSCQPKVYPNPSDGVVQISNCAEEVYGLQFISVSGQVMQSFENIGSTFELDLRGLNGGLYLLQWLDEKGSVLGAHRVVLK